MTLNENTSVWVYGYGLRGKSLAARLALEGIEIRGFLDRSAERYRRERAGTRICGPDEVEPSADMVVICSISNVFVHEQIADLLSERGFQYIVHKSFRDSPAGRAVNALYDRLTSALGVFPVKGLEVPAYADIAGTREELNAEEGGIVRADIPAELLFGLTRTFLEDSLLWKSSELLDAVPEKSLLYYTPPQKMMQYFMGEIDEESWERSRQLWEACRNAQSFANPGPGGFSREEQDANLEDRYHIFQKMDRLFSEKPSFFRENPISVVWNERGWFHIQDGNNRAAFMLAKGMYRIPARMTAADYAAWRGEEDAAAEVEAVLSQSKGQLRAPVLHPRLETVKSALEYYSHRKAVALCDWLWKQRMEPGNLTVCEYYCSNDLCGSHLARMGGKLTVVDTEDQLALHKALDRLYRLNAVQYGIGKGRSFQIIFSNRETALDELMEIGLRAEWYILEYTDKKDTEIEALAAACSLEKPQYIMRQLVGSRIYKTAAFKRGKST